MTVAPGTAALAAAVTFDAVPSVSSVSPGPCRMVAGFGRAVDAAAAAAVDELELDEDPVAPAMCDPARIPPASRPVPIRPADPSHLRLIGWRGALPWVSMCFPLSPAPGAPARGHGPAAAFEPRARRL